MKVRIENMLGASGKEVPNQFKLFTEDGTYFQSYSSVVAFRPVGGGKIQLDREKHDYSRTTAKYRNQFLRMTTKEIEKAITAGDIELVDLND